MFEAIASSVDEGDHNLVIQLNAVTEENDRLALHGMSKEDFAVRRSGQLARQVAAQQSVKHLVM